MQKYNIDIVLDAKQAKRTISEIDGSAKNATFAINRLAAAIGAIISVQTAKGIADMVQSYQAMAERVRMATKSQEEFNKVQQRLLQTANGTYRALSEAQELYIRTSSSLQSMGYNTDQVIDITDSLSYSFVRNATEADRAQIAINSFSRALSKGKLDVDGWEMLMVAIPTLADDIAESTGRTAQEIRALGASGKLSLSDLTEGLRNSRDANKELADSMATNLTDASVRWRNALAITFVEVEKQTGLISDFTKASIDSANELMSQAASGQMVEVFKANALAFRGFGRDIVTMLDALNTAFNKFGVSAMNDVDGVKKAFTQFPQNVRAMVQIVTIELAALVDKMSAFKDAAIATLNPFDEKTIADAKAFYKQRSDIAEQTRLEMIATALSERDETIRLQEAGYKKALELRQEYDQKMSESSSSGGVANLTVNTPQAGGGGRMKDGGDSFTARIQSETDALKAELDIRMATTQIYLDYGLRQQAETMNEEIKQLKGRTEAEIYEVNRRFQYEREARLAQYEAAMADERINDENKLLLKQEYQLQEQILEQIHQDELFRINEEAIAARAALDEMEKQRRLQTFLSLGNDLLNASQGQSKRMFEIGKKASLASAAIDGVRSALSAWRSGMETPGPYAPLVAAAYTASSLLKTGALINQIRSASYGGSGSLGGGGGVGSVSVPTGSVGGQSVSNIPQTQQQKMTVEIIGNDSDIITVGMIKKAFAESDDVVVTAVDSINDAQRRGVLNG